MGFMQRFERKLEDAVGNTFARVFGGKIVPAEVEDALHREAARGLQNLNGHELAPNHYVLTVSESDEENLTSDTELTLNAFAKHLTGYIGEQGWETYGAVSVALESSPDLHTGQFRARSGIAPDHAAPDNAAPYAGAPPPAPVAFPHPQPGAAQMPSEPHDAPPPRYQPQPDPQQYQPQAYSAGQYQDSPYQEPQYQEPQYQDPQVQDPQYQDPQYQDPQQPERPYGQQYPDQQYSEQQYQRPYGEQQYQQPEPPAQAYSERPQPGQNFPHQQRYGGEQYADPRFQPPAHLYPPQQSAPRPPAPQQPQQPQYQQPAPQQPSQYSQPGYGYQDQAFVGQEYPLRDPSSDYYAEERFAAPAGAPPQQEWTAHNPTVVLELGDGSGRNLELRRGSNIIGRGQDAHFRIPDTGVSRQHADVQWDGAVALIVDLQSTNGTVVNDTAVNEWQLADGDVIRVGHSDITVHFHQ